MIARPSKDFALFVVVGAAAAALNIGARCLIGRYTSFEAAIILAFPIALSFAYLLNRTIVFGPTSAPWHIEYMRFFMVNLVVLSQVWLVSVGLAEVLFPLIQFYWHPHTVGHTIGVLSPVATSYFAHKHFSFRRSSTSATTRNRT